MVDSCAAARPSGRREMTNDKPVATIIVLTRFPVVVIIIVRMSFVSLCLLPSTFAQVFHANGLALRLRQGTLLDQFDARSEQNLVLQGTLNVLGHLLQLRINVGGQSVQFHLDSHNVIIAFSVQRDKVVAAQSRVLHQNLLHLHGEHVDALDDEHVVK